MSHGERGGGVRKVSYIFLNGPKHIVTLLQIFEWQIVRKICFNLFRLNIFARTKRIERNCFDLFLRKNRLAALLALQQREKNIGVSYEATKNLSARTARFVRILLTKFCWKTLFQRLCIVEISISRYFTIIA